MKLSARMQKKYDLLIRLYRETKMESFAIFFAAFEGTEKTWTMMKKLYMRLIKLAARRGGESLKGQDVLALARRMAQKAGESGSIAFGDRVSVEDAALTGRFFREGSAQARMALLLGPQGLGAWALSPEEAAMARALAEKLPPEAPEVLTRVVKNQSDEREILGDIEFHAERRYGKARIGRVALACAVGVLGGWLLFRQAQTGVFLIAAARYETDRRIITATVEDGYPLPDSVIFSEKAPNIAADVMDKLDLYGDERQYRVDFLYYDREVVNAVRIDGEDIYALYRAAYTEAAEYGRIHKLIVNAVKAYYESYQMPFLPEAREEDFHSPFGTLYACVDWYANEHSAASSGFAALWSRREDIFGDPERFWQYIDGELFGRECAPLVRLLRFERLIEQAASTGEETAALREAYETQIFAYYHIERGAVNFSPLAVALPQESGSRYTTRLGDYGRAIAAAVQAAAEADLEGHALASAMLAYDDASAFSAVFSGAELRALAGNEKVTVLAIAFPEVPLVYPGKMDARLAAELSFGEQESYRVYRVETQPWVFYTNYLIPQKLPRSLIADLRGVFHSENTAYEMILGFDYDVLYGLADHLSRRELFRRLGGSADACYISATDRTYNTIVPLP